MHRHILSLAKHFRVPEQPVNPPLPDPEPQITRADYRHEPPQERLAVADQLIIALEECWHSIDFLERSDPDVEEGFPGAKMVLVALINKTKDYRRDRVMPWVQK